MKAMSLFAGGGIGETYLSDIGIHTMIANELVKERADIYQYRFPETEMVIGDIKEKKSELIEKGRQAEVKLLLATPPCQGMSALGRRDFVGDERNYLIFDIFDVINALDFDYILIENVPKFLKMYYPENLDDIISMEVEQTVKRNREMVTETVQKYIVKDGVSVLQLPELIQKKFGEKYEIKYGIYNASDYGVPQKRKRAIIRLFKKGLQWDEPEKSEHQITLFEAIGNLPSIEAGESFLQKYPELSGTEIADEFGYKYHNAPYMNERHREMMRHTPTGCSAYDNTGDELEDGKSKWVPRKKSDNTPIKGFVDTYRRLKWDSICPTRTMKYDNISHSNNGHPGRLDKNNLGLYTDARTLTLLELIIISSLPRNVKFPENTKDSLIGDIIGEGIPPKMLASFLSILKT